MREARSFLTAAFAEPVPRDHHETPRARLRRRIIVAVTLVVGAATLGLSLRIAPGDNAFYLATAVLAVVWAGGALLAGPLHVGWTVTRRGGRARPVVQPLVVGIALLTLFALGAVVVAQVPALRDPVDHLLDHTRRGSLPLVLVITAGNGVAEELYFRGALYAALPHDRALLATTLLYVLATAASGVPLLAFAGLVLGLVTALQRRVTGGVLAPIVTHLTWSLGMLVILPTLLDHLR